MFQIGNPERAYAVWILFGAWNLRFGICACRFQLPHPNPVTYARGVFASSIDTAE